jgi:ribonuclease HI
LRYVTRLDYSDPSNRCTNNTTEYEALLLGLRKVRALGASKFLVKCDAEVIKDHVEKESEAKQPELVKYLAEVQKMERHFWGSPLSFCQGKEMAKLTSWQRKPPGGGDASRCIL